MGGSGSGRPPSARTLVNRQLGVGNNQVLPAGDSFRVPNHSGDHSAGRVDSTPTGELDLVNKKYVDDNSSITTASNIGAEGSGVFASKVGDDLQFRNLASANDRLSISIAETDEVAFNLDETNIDHGNLTGLADDDHTQYQKETDFTAGSVLFRGASVIAQDNSGLFWDNTQKRLGIGETNPTATLEVKGSIVIADGNRFTVKSAGDDKTFQFWHDDTNSRLQATQGQMKISAIEAGKSVWLISSANSNMFFDAGNTFQFRNVDNSNAIQLTIDSANGSLIWTGTGGLCYSSSYGNEIAWSQAMSQNTTYPISDATIAEGNTNNMSNDGNGKITITKAGMYKVDWAVTAEHSATGKHILWGISKDGTLQNQGQQHRETKTANAEYQLSGTAILDLAVNEYIEICLRSADATPATATVSHINMTVVQVGGT